MFQGCILGVLLMYFKACSSAVTLLGENTRYFAANEPLSVECNLTGSTTDIDFRYNSAVVVTCEPVFGCNRFDANFNVNKTDSRYILHTVNNFNANLCGAYQCTDTVSSNSDTVTVLYKEFDNDTFTVDEQDNSLNITTACVFPATSENITVTWYSYENSLQQLNLATATLFNETVSETDCSNVSCGSDQAKRFSLGLSFGKLTGKYVLAAIEVHIVHSLFDDKPLVWRSSKTYPVKGVEFKQDTGISKSVLIGVLSGFTIVTLIIVIITNGCLTKRMRGYRKRYKVSNLTLFTFIKDTSNIADKMTFVEKAKGELIKLVGDSHFNVLIEGSIYVFSGETIVKSIEEGEGFGEFSMIYGITENAYDMESEITVKNDNLHASAKIHALSSRYILKTSSDVKLLKLKNKSYMDILMEQKKTEWKSTLYREVLSECGLFKNITLEDGQSIASEFEAVCFSYKEELLRPTKISSVEEGSGSQRTGAGGKKRSHRTVPLKRFDRLERIGPEECDDQPTVVAGNATSKDIFIIIKGSAETTCRSDHVELDRRQYNKFDYFETTISPTTAIEPVLCVILSSKIYQKKYRDILTHRGRNPQHSFASNNV